MCFHQNYLIAAILMTTYNIPFSKLPNKIALKYPKTADMRVFFSKELKNKFETVVVNEASVFEPLSSNVFFKN